MSAPRFIVNKRLVLTLAGDVETPAGRSAVARMLRKLRRAARDVERLKAHPEFRETRATRIKPR